MKRLFFAAIVAVLTILLPIAACEAWICVCSAGAIVATIDHGTLIFAGLTIGLIALRLLARRWDLAFGFGAVALLASDRVAHYEYTLLLAVFLAAAGAIARQGWRSVRERDPTPLLAVMLGALLLVFVGVVQGSSLGAYAMHSVRGEIYPEPIPSARAHINRWGLRGPERPLSKRVGVHRLAILGDSTTYGWMVSEGDSYARQTERLLGDGWEVINAGVPSYGLDAMRERYLSRVSAHHPDVVLIVDGGNQDAGGAIDYEASLRRTIHEIRVTGARPMLAVYPYGPASNRSAWVDEVKWRVAAELGLDLVDLDVVTRDGWQLDGRHPNMLGHLEIARAVAGAFSSTS